MKKDDGTAYAILLGHEDNATREHLLRELRGSGFARVAIAESGREVIETLARSNFDLLLTDVQLPDIDAWRLARMVHTGDFCSDEMPVVALCPKEGSFDVTLLAEQNSTVVVDPTIDANELREHLARIIQQRVCPRVLVIEDDLNQAEAVNLALQRTYDVDVCSDGPTGLQAWKDGRHDLILLDLMLPGLAGADVLDAIIAIDPEQPVVIVTAHGSQETHADLMLHGAAFFIEKPLNLDHLRETCVKALRHKELVDQYRRTDAADTLIDHLSSRIIAANHSMEQGRTMSTHNHLRNALARCIRKPLSEDEWATLVSEFD